MFALMDYDIVYSALRDAAVSKETDRYLQNRSNIKYKCGKKIFEKILSAIKGNEMEGRLPFDPFDLWKGRNFVVNLKQVSNFNNYDDSKFAETAGPLLGGNEVELEKVYKSEYPLKEYSNPDVMLKPYEELKARFEEVLEGMDAYENLGMPSGSRSQAPRPATSSKPKFSKPIETENTPFETDDDKDGGESESALDYYKNLAKE